MLLIALACLLTAPAMATPYAAKPEQATSLLEVQKKRKQGYKKPRSKKILGIFNRKSDCGCPK